LLLFVLCTIAIIPFTTTTGGGVRFAARCRTRSPAPCDELMSGLFHTLALRRTVSRLRNTVRRILLQHASPHQIALGVAIGVFFGVFPTFGFAALVVLAVAPFLRFNVAAALAGGTLFSNPVTTPLWIFLSCLVVGIDVSSLRASGTVAQLVQHYGSVMVRYLVGNVVISVIASLMAYYGVRGLHHVYRRRLERKLGNGTGGGMTNP